MLSLREILFNELDGLKFGKAIPRKTREQRNAFLKAEANRIAGRIEKGFELRERQEEDL